MKKLGLLCVLLLLSVGLFALTATANHQVQLNVNEVAVLALNSTATITLETHPPVVAGDEPQGDTDATKLLRYTSLVPDSTTRRMTVAWARLTWPRTAPSLPSRSPMSCRPTAEPR